MAPALKPEVRFIVLLIAIIFLKMNIKTLSISLLTLVSPFTTSSIILKIPNTKAKNTNPKAPQYTNHSNPQISQLFDTHFVRIWARCASICRFVAHFVRINNLSNLSNLQISPIFKVHVRGFNTRISSLNSLFFPCQATFFKKISY